MEEMDCDSPKNSVSESEGAPTKKPKLVATIKPLISDQDKDNSTVERKKQPKLPLTIKIQNEINVTEPEDNDNRSMQESELSEGSLEMNNGNDMIVEDLEPESNKENYKVDNNEQVSLDTENSFDLSSAMNVEEISQEEIEYLIHMENGRLLSPSSRERFLVHRSQANKMTGLTSLSDTGDTEWNSVEEMTRKSKKIGTVPQRPKLKRSLSYKKHNDLFSDTSDEGDQTNGEQKMSHKPLKRVRPSTSSAHIIKVKQVDEYDDEADDEPERIDEATEVSHEKTTARLKRLMKLSASNIQDNKAEAKEDNDINDNETAARTSLVCHINKTICQQFRANEVDDDEIFDEVEPGFQSNDCNEFSEILHINNNNDDDDLAIPGCSKMPDRPLSPIPMSVWCSDSDNDEPGPSRRALKRARSPSLSDSETDGEEGSVQAQRKANIKHMRLLMTKFRKETDTKSPSTQGKGKSLQKGKAPMKRKRGAKDDDHAFKFHGFIPTEKRRSSRLQNKNPEYHYGDLDEVQETFKHIYLKRPNYNLDHLAEELDDLEKVVQKPKRKSFKKKVEEHVIIPVEKVTQEMLDNIALRVKGKIYSADGTTCHQCRQKTMDQKTCCRNPECSGMLGMFCGVCIKNRYGEDAAEALLDPNWSCPVCRGRCNCSICRTKQGKRPTGVLAPLAQQSGYESVDHFLDTLRGEGDRPKDDYKYKYKRDSEALLGFSNDGRKLHLQDGSTHSVSCILCSFNDCANPKNLLGFSKDGNYAIMGGRRLELLYKPKNFFFSLLRLQQI